ncbi:hypothetical protein D3C76_1219000 [compost metagenome]
MGQWPVVDDDGGETCGDDGATATDIAYAGCAQGVDLGIGGSGNDGRGAVSGNRTDMHVAETGYWDHAIPFLGVGYCGIPTITAANGTRSSLAGPEAAADRNCGIFPRLRMQGGRETCRSQLAGDPDVIGEPGVAGWLG